MVKTQTYSDERSRDVNVNTTQIHFTGSYDAAVNWTVEALVTADIPLLSHSAGVFSGVGQTCWLRRSPTLPENVHLL